MRIKSIFSDVANSIRAAFQSTQGISFDSTFLASIESDKIAIENFKNAVLSGTPVEEAFANTMREASSAAQEYVQSMNASTVSQEGFEASVKMSEVATIAQNKSLGSVRSIMNEYNSGMVNCGLNQQQFIDSVNQGNSILGGYIAKVGVGNATMAGYVGTLVSAKVATIGLRIATTALNAVIGMGIGLIVSLITSGISALIEKIKESCKSTAEQLEDVNTKLQEISSTVKTTISDFQNLKTNVEDIAPRFAELAKGVDAFGNNVSLTDEEYAEFLSLNNKIAELFPELQVGMDSNGNYMLSMAYSADTLTQSLNDLVEAERKAANEEIAKQIPDAINEISDFDKLTQKEIKEYQNRIDLYNSSYAELSNLYSKEAEEALKKNYGDNWETYRNTMVQTTTAAMTDIMQAWGEIGNSEDSAAWTAMIDDFILDSGEIDWWKLINSDEFEKRIALFEREIDNAEAAIKEKWKSLASYMNSWVQTDDTFNMLNDDMQNVVSKMVSNLEYGTDGLKDSEDIKKYITDNIIEPIQNATPEVQQMFSDLFSISTDDISIGDYIQQIKDKAKEISENSDFTYDEILKNTGFDNIIENYEKQADKIVDLLKDSVDNNTDKINELKNKIYDLTATDLERVSSLVTDYGLKTWEEIQSALENKTFDELFTIDVETEGLENFTSAIKESTSATGLSAESIENLEERYKDLDSYNADELFEKTANGIHLNTDALRELESEYEKQNKQDIDKKLEGLVEQYNNLTEEINGTADASEKALLYQQRQNVLDEINDTAELASMYEGLTSAYNKWQEAQSMGEEGDMYDSMRDSLENIKELWEQGLVGTNEFRAYVDLLSGKDLSTASIDEVIAAYEELNNTIQGTSYTAMDFLAEGSDGCINFLNAVSELNSSWANMNEDGSWNIDFGFGDDEEIAKALGVDIEFVQSILRKLSDYGFDINLDSVYSKLNLVQSEADAANQKLIELGKTEVVFDFSGDDLETINSQIEQAKTLFEQFVNEDGTVNLTLEGAEEAQGILATLIYQKQSLDQAPILKVDTTEADSDVEKVIAKLQEFKASYNNLKVQTEIGADTSEAEASANGLLEEISGLDAEILTTLGIDTTSIETLNSTINAIKPEVMVTAGLDASLIEGYQSEEHTAEGTVIWDNNIDKVTAWTKQSHTTNGTVNWNNNTRNVKTNFYATGTINWNSSGKAQGTAYSRGNWGTKENGVALGGEVGQELLVRDGKFYTIGDDSAEFFQYKKGDIIFNAEQTRQIFANGKIKNGKKRGVSYSNGTAFSGGSGRFTSSGGTVYKAGGNSSNSSSDSSSSSSSSSSKSSSSSTSDNELQTFDWIEVAISRIERVIDKLKNTATSTYKALKTKLGATADEISEVNQELSLQEQAYNRYMQEANSVGLSSGLASKVRDGSINIEEYDDDTKELISSYKEWYEKALDCSDAIDTLHESLASLYEDDFNNIKDDYDNQLGLLEHLTNTYNTGIDKLEAEGKLESTKYYSALINVEKQNVGVLNKELNALIQSFSDAMASGEIEEYSESWYSMQQNINDTKEAIDEANLSMIEYGKTMREIEWGYFDYEQDKISQLTSEADFLIDLMSNEKLYDDNGSLTNEGLSTMGLHGVNYNVYMAQADDYAAEILKLDKEIANDPYNTDLIDRREELLGLQQESILAAEEEKQAIVDMVEEGIQIELDALKDLIDSYTDALDSSRSLYEYQKKIEEKTKNIASLQKQLSAYSNDVSEETKAKVQKITVELQEAKDDLAETEYEQFITDTKKILDELYIEYEGILNQRLDDVDLLISNMIDTVNSNSGTINDTITSTADSVGYTLTTEMTNIWGNAVTSMDGVIAKYDKDYGSQLTTVNSVLSTISSTVAGMVEKSNEEATKTVTNTTTTTKPVATTTTTKTTTTTPTTTKSSTPTRSDKDNYGVALAIINGNYGWGSGETRKKNLTAKGFNYSTVQGIVNKLMNEGYVNSGAWVGRYYGIKDLSPYHYNKYLHGGLINYTGIAQVDGTPNNPEMVLSAEDTENFIKLRNVLRAMSSQALTMGSTFDFDTPTLTGISDVSSRLATLSGNAGSTGTTIGDISITIPIEHIDDYNDFVKQLQQDKQFEKLIQSMTIDRLAGGSSLAKNKYKW